ncbi:hypothetical protein BN1708_019948, partial [Verticillium longisporum]
RAAHAVPRGPRLGEPPVRGRGRGPDPAAPDGRAAHRVPRRRRRGVRRDVRPVALVVGAPLQAPADGVDRPARLRARGLPDRRARRHVLVPAAPGAPAPAARRAHQD